MRQVTAALLQLRTPTEQAAAVEHLSQAVRDAAGRGAALIVTPEFSNLVERDAVKLRARARPSEDDLVVVAARSLARELSVWLLLGSAAVQVEEGWLANRSLLIDPAGAITSTYDKVHLFDISLPDGAVVRESETFAAGNRAVVASTPWGGLGLTICYDVRFPGLYRALAHAGARMIAVPAAFTATTGKAHWETLIRARAIETGAFILAPAQGGRHEDGRRTWGRTMVVDPSGAIIASAPDDEPCVVVTTLDLSLVDLARSAIPAWNTQAGFALPPAVGI